MVAQIGVSIMRDVGSDVRRRSGHKVEAALAKTAGDLMQNWTKDNFYAFEQTMEMIRENAPVQFARLYLDAVKLGLDRNTNINININRQQDRENLQALVRSRIPNVLSNEGTYVPFEEVKPKELSSLNVGEGEG